MNRIQPTTLIATVLIVTMAPQSFATTESEIFDQLFSEHVRIARSSRDAADDLALAKMMLNSASKIASPTLTKLLVDNSYELSRRHKDGFEIAAESLELLAEKLPDQAINANTKRLSLYQTRYSGSRGLDRTEAAAALVEIAEEIADQRIAASDYRQAMAFYRRAQSIARKEDPDGYVRLKQKIMDVGKAHRAAVALQAVQDGHGRRVRPGPAVGRLEIGLRVEPKFRDAVDLARSVALYDVEHSPAKPLQLPGKRGMILQPPGFEGFKVGCLAAFEKNHGFEHVTLPSFSPAWSGEAAAHRFPGRRRPGFHRCAGNSVPSSELGNRSHPVDIF